MKKLLFSVLLLAFSIAYSEPVAEELQVKLNNIQSMTANFSQVVKAKKREVSNSQGTMALERPGRFRWQTKSPMEQLVVADSKKLWVYDVELEQVTVKKQEKGLGGTAALFLSGYDDTVTRDFNVTVTNQGKNQLYDLHAKSPKENFQQVKLLFSKDMLIGIELFDQLGQHTVVKLTNIKSNPKLAGRLFQFKPPKGVDVVQQ